MDKHAMWPDVSGAVMGHLQASDVLGPALMAGGIGMGARGIKRLIDLKNHRDLLPKLPPIPQSSTPIPVDVSPEEAAELERGGLQVKHASDGLGAGLATGMVMAPAAYAGWKLLDNHFAKQREGIMRKRLASTQQRVEGLMNDSPVQQDVGLHGAMKVAEAFFFKQAGPLEWAGIPIGLAGTLLGVSAYKKSRRDNSNAARIQALRSYMAHQDAPASEAELMPVVHDREQKTHQPALPAPEMAQLAPDQALAHAPVAGPADLQALGQKVARVLQQVK
jgi:hypothetical protein